MSTILCPDYDDTPMPQIPTVGPLMKKVIPLYWHRSINFGDQLSPYIVENITGEKVCYCDHLNDCIRLMCTGSILADPHVDKAVIWGNGFAWEADPVYTPHEILAVRGPETRRKFMEKEIACPEVYGDPGILLSELYHPVSEGEDCSIITEKYAYGIAPHLVDFELTKYLYGSRSDVKVIDLREPIEKVIGDILDCRVIYSSSLHGIITAHSYGIPAAWVKFSDKVIGDDFKFRDYYHSLDMEAEFVDFRSWNIGNELKMSDCKAPELSKVKEMQGKLMKALFDYLKP
jgi:pyruvyltransferase